jgi:colanic acid/amylovoran biosynthesis glycosyltransferase
MPRIKNKWMIVLLICIGIWSRSAYSQIARPLKILFVVSSFPAASQTFIVNIMAGLIERGHDVTIFSFHKGDKHAYLHHDVKKYHLLKKVIYKKFPKNIPTYDIVFCQFGYVGKTIAEMKELHDWLKKRKMVVCFRGSDITRKKWNNTKIYKNMFKTMDLALPVCNYFKRRLIALGCAAKKIKVHYSAIDCSRFRFRIREKKPEDPIHLISVSRLVTKKGIDFAIKAVALLIQKYPNLHFTIVGDGPERTYLNLLIRQLGLEDAISLCGWQSQEEVISLLDKAHIFLLPSRSAPDGNKEGIANALKEAMAMGLISIGTFHAGTPELIENGITGFLVPEKSIVELSQAIEYVIEHPEDWQRIALAARKKVEEKFETTKSIQRLEHIFYQLLSK